MIGFIGSTLSLLILFAASAAPIPLYEHYATLLDLTKGDLALTSVMYFIGTITALLFFARISNYWGRKITIYLILLLSILGCTAFIFADSEILIFTGRFVQGISCGLASSTVMAFVLDNEPKKFPNIGVSITGAGPNLGLVIGAVGTGLFTQFIAANTASIFIIIIAALILCLILIFGSKETISRQPGILHSLSPKLNIPVNIKPLLLPAACTAFSGWAFGGFYQSYSATIATQIFQVHDTFIASLVFISYIAPAAIGAMLAKNYDGFKAQLYGMVLFIAALLAIYSSLFIENLFLYLIINVFAGIFQGIMFAGSLKTILSITAIDDRADVLSAIYVISYSGAAIPNLIISQVANNFDLPQLVLGYVLLAIVCCLILLFSRRNITVHHNEQLI